MITLETLAQATEQQVFDQVKAHLLKQGERSVNSNGKCMYRLGELRCAAGCLIADDEYQPAIEAMSWAYLGGIRFAPDNHVQLIDNLQRLHDNVLPKDWPQALAELAHRHGLID